MTDNERIDEIRAWLDNEPESTEDCDDKLYFLLRMVDETKENLDLAIRGLEYYAHPERYRERTTMSGVRPPGVLLDSGTVARHTLMKLRGVDDGKS